MTRLYRDGSTWFAIAGGQSHKLGGFDIDAVFRADDPAAFVEAQMAAASGVEAADEGAIASREWDAPVGGQEVWAAGVTYYRSRTARMEESEEAGGARFYDLVYDAERPELFFKGTGARARGHRQPVGIRQDSTWDVPEPELTLAVDAAGRIFGYCVGNDMSSRSIEGENPLYLPQAKVYRGSCALGPCLTVGKALSERARIGIEVFRAGNPAFNGETDVSQIKRPLDELAEYLFRENEFPAGAYLMTGTGIVPDTDFTLRAGDEIRISIEGLGELVNTVA
ncbi:fumarylacetoacetate hydrolase family protein [soil metagenome]